MVMAKYRTLEEALRAADYGVLYCYVAPSLRDGWLPERGGPQLRWYEKLVSIERSESAGFLREAGADQPFAFVAVGHGFTIFVARNAAELSEKRESVRPWVESLVQSYVADGVISPQTYRFPPDAQENPKNA
jgi:hypothetical protein